MTNANHQEAIRRVDTSKLDFTNEQELHYFSEALFGEKVRDFLNGEIGRYLHGRAKLEYEEAKEKAIHCNTDSAYGQRKLAQYQKQADTAACFMRWCAEAIQNGDESFQLMEEIRTGNH